MKKYDATLILGGGVAPDGGLTPWMEERCKFAASFDNESDYFLALTQGTVYKPYPLKNNWPVFDSDAVTEKLLSLGINEQKIIKGTPSRDTIGDALFTRVMHTDIRQFRDLLVITSEFHMPRTQAIFDWIFSLDNPNYSLTYRSSNNAGIDGKALLARKEKELKALNGFLRQKKELTTLADVHRWLYTEHNAYKARQTIEVIPRITLKSY
ncbi:MAG: YdcF family protein [Neptuniibacter sp.]